MTDPRTSADPFLERERLKYAQPIPSREYILQRLSPELEQGLTQAQLTELLEIQGEEQCSALHNRLRAMVRDGQLIRNKRGKYFNASKLQQVQGLVIGNREGFGFLKVEGYARDLFLNYQEMRKCLSGDRVIAQILPKLKGREEAKIRQVLEPRSPLIVAYFYRQNDKGYLKPYSLELPERFEVDQTEQWADQAEQWVLAEIMDRGMHRRPGRCRILKTFGGHDRLDIGSDLALAEHQIPTQWSSTLLKSLDELPALADRPSSSRRDLTHLPFFTIDGAGAKDLDDAVYCCPLQKGWRLWVAIADVSHYVGVNNALDEEARKRGTSVYFDHLVVPMLPPELSNDLCSLNPGVNRLAFVCEMQINETGELKAYTFYEATIRSRQRLTYETAQRWLDGKQTDLLNEQERLLTSVLRHLCDLYQVRIHQRIKRGAIQLRLEEVFCLYDAQGRIRQIMPAGLLSESHGLIEECMILANIASAKAMLSAKVFGLHRVHEKPDVVRLKELLHFLKTLPRFKDVCGTKPFSMRLLREILAHTRLTPDAAWVHTLVLRTMRPAYYGVQAEGHFGLALHHYTHFTSPIRRYPDLVVHRILKSLFLKPHRDTQPYEETDLVAISAQSTALEKRAEKASREAFEWLKYQFLAQQVDYTCTGVIMNVSGQGLTVRLPELLTDGVLPLANLPADQYRHSAKDFCLRGEASGMSYRLGDSLKVFVRQVNFLDRMVSLGLTPASAKIPTEEKQKTQL